MRSPRYQDIKLLKLSLKMKPVQQRLQKKMDFGILRIGVSTLEWVNLNRRGKKTNQGREVTRQSVDVLTIFVITDTIACVERKWSKPTKTGDRAVVPKRRCFWT